MTVSSTEAGAAEAVAGTEIATDVNAPDASAGGENKGVGSMRDAVEAALKVPEAPPASEPDPKGSEPKDPAEPPAPTDPDELSEEEKRKLSKSAQRRFHELHSKAKTAEGMAKEFQQELTELKPKAERMEQLTGFMREHEITPDHLNNALGLTAMINKGEFDRALPILENLLNQVRTAAGDVLPADLRKQVDLGYITEAHAKELHKAKVAETRARQTVQQTQQREAEQREQRDREALVGRVTTVADAWEADQVTTDPDWNQKRDLVLDAVDLELRKRGPEKYPRTEKDVRELLAKAKQDVEGRITRFRPPPKPIDHVTGKAPSPRSVAAPKSMLDAINVGLAAANSG